MCVVSACDVGEFMCVLDKSCTNIYGVCDGKRDCVDGSDELDCGKPFTNSTVYTSVVLLSAVGR